VVALLLDWCLPDALMEKKGCGDTPLHTACRKIICNTPTVEVISLLLERFPDAAACKNTFGCLPLHITCQYSRRTPDSLGIVSLLLDVLPTSAKEKNLGGNTPLHYACEYWAPSEVVSLLLEKSPGAAKEKNKEGQTPLHRACCGESYDTVKILLEHNPNALKEKDFYGEVPRCASFLEGINPTAEMAIIIQGVCKLVLDDINDEIAEEIMNRFVKAKWWGGVKHVFDFYATTFLRMNVPTKVVPSAFSMIGHRCRLLTMWDIIRNSQDLLSGVST